MIKEDKNPIPFEVLLGQVVTQPILSEEVEEIIKDAIVPITHSKSWNKWGMNSQGKKGTKLLLVGPPGCGKTTVARWLAKKVSNSIIAMTMADIGSSDPGSTERHVRDLFTWGKKHKNATIFMDECDALLWSRENAGKDSMFLIGVINQLLIQIEQYPGLVILATNFQKILDPALERRLSYIVEIPRPDYETRKLLWDAKIPEDYPIQLNAEQIEEISITMLSGSEIETVIDQATRHFLRQNERPYYAELKRRAEAFQNKTGNNSKSSRTKSVVRLATNSKRITGQEAESH